MLLGMLLGMILEAFGSADNHIQRPCLIVYHIGKAGGESLHRWAENAGLRLWTHYGKGGLEIFDRPSDRGTSKTWSRSVHDADVIMGHFVPRSRSGSFTDALQARNFTRKCQQWTILRDPLDLQASMLAYLYPGREDAWKDCLLNLWLEGDGPCQSNEQRGRHPFLHSSMCHSFDGQLDHWNRYNYDRDRGWPPTCQIHQAQQSLNNLNSVGFTEDMVSTIAAWAELFGLPTKATSWYAHTHVTKNNHGFGNLSANVQMAIVETSREDIILYRWAQMQFHRSSRTPIQATSTQN